MLAFRHFNHDFNAFIAARAVHLVSVHDIRERQPMSDQRFNVEPAAGDNVERFPSGGLIGFDGCSYDGMSVTALMEQQLEIERYYLTAGIAEKQDVAAVAYEVKGQVDGGNFASRIDHHVGQLPAIDLPDRFPRFRVAITDRMRGAKLG
jgi:hypothetical protein